MRTVSPKLFLSITLFFSTIFAVSAQNTALHASFKGTAPEIKTSIQANTLVFTMSGMETKSQLDDFLKRAQVYAKGFTLTATQVNGAYQCSVNFNGTPDLKWLQRFFISVSVADVKLDSGTKTIDEFFQIVQ
jgi:hypothetical protein